MKEQILNKLTNKKETELQYIYDKNKMKKVNLMKLLLFQSTKLEIFFLILGILGAVVNGITLQFLEYYTGKLITYFSSDNSTDVMFQHLKDILTSYIIASIISFFLDFY